MKILFVLANYHPYVGGAEKVFKRLTEGLATRGHSIKVITRQLHNSPYQEELNHVQIERVRVPGLAQQYLFSVFSMSSVIREAGTSDLIHTSSNYGALSAFMVAKVAKKPLVFTCNEVLGNRWQIVEPKLLKARTYQLIENIIVKLPYDRYVAISQATLRDLLQTGVNSSKACFIHCGVDEVFLKDHSSADGRLRNYLGLKPCDFLYVYFGRPGATKGVDYLLKAALLVNTKIPNAHLALILAHEPHEHYQRLLNFIQKNGLESNVHIITPFNQVEELIQNLIDANCIVIPSLTEGFGLTTVEACTLGIPVVATRTGSIPEVISGRHLLVNPCSPEAIYEGVLRVWRGECDWTAPKQFSWDDMVSRYESIYQELIQCV